MYIKPITESSFSHNDLGRTLYDLVIANKPNLVIEFGALNGHSTIAIAQALKDLRKGSLKSYDLWDKYKYKHSLPKRVKESLEDYGVDSYVTLHYGDLFEWLKNPEPFDMLVVDISNTGDVIEALYRSVKPFIDKGAVVVFEGGSDERDQVEWMVKYGKRPIKGSAPYEIINSDFPSLSKLI